MYEVFNLYLPLIPYDIMPVKLHNCNLLLPKMFKYILYGIRIVMKLFLFVSQNIIAVCTLSDGSVSSVTTNIAEVY